MPSLPYVCRSCLRKLWIQKLPFGTPRRSISQNWLRKTEEAKKAWGAQKEEIVGGKKDSMLTVLEERGYVNAVVGFDRAIRWHPTPKC